MTPGAIARILVIKHGALGDVVLATGPFAAIRAFHRDAHIVLLTTAPFAELARACGYFDEVWEDARPGWAAPAGWWALRRRLREGRFDRVYDLQTSDRSSFYLALMGPGPRPEWSGIARGASHPHLNPRRDHLHTVERQAEQLKDAGIAVVPPPALDWLDADISRFDLPPRFALLVPGGSAHRPAKRWPVARYGELGRGLEAQDVVPVVLGGPPDAGVTAAVAQESGGRDLTGATSLAEVVALARAAAGAVGNDTGPMHLIATAGAPSVVLFGHASNPDLCAPRGPDVTVLQEDDIATITVAEVEAALTLR